jgi:predicted transcriptional regulator
LVRAQFSLGPTKELVLAKSRSTFGKRDREMAKTAKANAKRARRDARADEPVEPIVDNDGTSADELVERLKELHDAFEDNRMSFEEFDEARSDLVDRIALKMAAE